MSKSIYEPEFRAGARCLYELRQAAQLSQVQLAERLGHPQSWISGGETGLKRLDLYQIYRWVTVCGSTMARFGKMVDRKIAAAAANEKALRTPAKRVRKPKQQ